MGVSCERARAKPGGRFSSSSLSFVRARARARKLITRDERARCPRERPREDGEKADEQRARASSPGRPLPARARGAASARRPALVRRRSSLSQLEHALDFVRTRQRCEPGVKKRARRGVALAQLALSLALGHPAAHALSLSLSLALALLREPTSCASLLDAQDLAHSASSSRRRLSRTSRLASLSFTARRRRDRVAQKRLAAVAPPKDYAAGPLADSRAAMMSDGLSMKSARAT